MIQTHLTLNFRKEPRGELNKTDYSDSNNFNFPSLLDWNYYFPLNMFSDECTIKYAF